MGRRHLGLAIVLGVSLLGPATRAQAQFGGLSNDPFALYFGYYLPHQAAIAAQATPIDTINAAQSAAQFRAARDRTGLYDPVSPFGEDDLDPLRPYGSGTRRERMVRPHTFPTSTVNARMRGNTPPLYYNRTAQYYQTLRVGRGPNQNLAISRSGGRFSSGSYGTPSTNPQAYANPGPR